MNVREGGDLPPEGIGYHYAMQILGLSDSTPKTESRLKTLFWPTIRNEFDVEYITRQGFWICVVVAMLTLAAGLFAEPKWAGAFDALFFLMGGIGIRRRSRFAAVAVFLVYLLTAPGFSILRIIFLGLLLANVRGVWLSARWTREGGEQVPAYVNPSIWDTLSGTVPTFLWPKARVLFYLLAGLEFVGVAMVLRSRIG